MTTTESIVALLAECSPIEEEHNSCVLCGAGGCTTYQHCASKEKLEKFSKSENHFQDCPWRLAVEWKGRSQS